VKLAQHTYSNLFGTFLYNSAKERNEKRVDEKTVSVWKFLRAPANYDKFRNNLYVNCDSVSGTHSNFSICPCVVTWWWGHWEFLWTVWDLWLQVLWPSCEVRDLVLWSQVYLGYENPPSIFTKCIINPSQDSSPAESVVADGVDEPLHCNSFHYSSSRRRSCGDLANIPSEGTIHRNKSDSSL